MQKNIIKKNSPSMSDGIRDVVVVGIGLKVVTTNRIKLFKLIAIFFVHF